MLHEALENDIYDIYEKKNKNKNHKLEVHFHLKIIFDSFCFQRNLSVIRFFFPQMMCHLREPY